MRQRGALVCGLLLLATGASGAPAATPTPLVARAATPAPDLVAAKPDTLGAETLAAYSAKNPAATASRLPRVALAVLLFGSLLATLGLAIAVLVLRRSRNRTAAAYAELQRANAALESKLKIRTGFLATTSHEIRTPLNGILGMTQVMLADHKLAPDLRERISAAQSAGETMKALVDDILDMAKIESGNLTIERAPLDMRTLLAETVQLWRPQAESKGVRLDLDLAACPGLIESDRVRLRQIACNLLSNALKFTAQGSVSISATVEPRNGRQMMVLRVKDTGIGIAPEQQGLVFEQFRQADGSIMRRFGGTGLGLAICRNVVEAMGGMITLKSRLGEGSTFTVRLPFVAVEDSAPAQADGPDLRASALADARLLIVEENALTRRILCNMLDGFVGRIEAVATIQEARDRLAAGGIDHVVADAASGAPAEAGAPPPIERLATSAFMTGARMTLLFPPSRAEDAAQLIAVRPEVQPIAKPIAAPALVGALDGLYAAGSGPNSDRDMLAAIAAE
jgi:signal transduction histidine kinase